MDGQETIGSTLRRRREERGLTVEDAALQSRVPVRLVYTLESDDYHLLPDPLYLLRLLHEYAAFLGLDPEGLEAEFRAAIRRPPRAALATVVPPRPAPQIPWKHVLWTAIALAVVTPLVFIALSLASKRAADRAMHGQVVASGSSGAAAARDDERMPAERRLGSALPTTAEPSRPPVEGGGEAPASSAPIGPALLGASAPAAEPPTSPGTGHVLIARAHESTWISVRADGRERKQLLLQPGQTARFEAETRLQVTVGNAGGVTLWLDGSALPALGRSGEVVRDMVLPPQRSDSPPAGPPHSTSTSS
jgi:cytoskeletal protein RodZ